MTTRRHEPRTHHTPKVALIGAIVTLIACSTLLAAGAGAAEPDPDVTRRTALELAQERLDDARRFATEIAGKMSAAESQKAELEGEIAKAEAEIPALRAHADDLHRQVRERAARLYVRSAAPKLDALVSTTNVVDVARAAHFTETIGDHDSSLAVELQTTAHALETRQVQLRSQRADLERTIASLVPLRELLDAKLAVAASAYDKVKDALAKKADQFDVDTGALVCPVKGLVVFTDDFGEPRDGGTTHEGIDMPALEGTPVVAVVDGLLVQDESPGGGHGAWLYGVDDVAYYYAHFSRYEGTGGLVKTGDVIGYVGTTGVSTGPHLHFEVHPKAGAAVDGFALLLSLCADESAVPRG
ncbi:MAG TPA: peptidoglycan DD-metalloendopeptidase family protein [Acidimicrobiia bacterium]|nr:peptidoglycan DD-metalloendopeptidase family protein [Acidimicrobiia bacterium]